MIKDPQPDHKAALVFAETYTTASMGQEQPRKYNLATCYLDLTQRHERFAFDCAESRSFLHEKIEGLEQQLAAAQQGELDAMALVISHEGRIEKLDAELRELRKAARDSLDAHIFKSDAADAALRKLLGEG